MKEKVTIVKAGGRVLDSAEELNKLMTGFSKIDGKKVLVHGGGVFITELCAKLDIDTQMVDGRRITSAENMDVVLMACAGKLNKELVSGLNKLGMSAVGLCGGDLSIINSVKRPPQPIDFGMVGDVTGVDIKWLEIFLNNGAVPVLSSISQSNEFELLNTNADTIAAETASALAKVYDVTLYFYFDRPGVLSNSDNLSSVIDNLTVAQIEKMKQEKTIHTGMLPKLKNGIYALENGVVNVVLGDRLEGLKGTKLHLK